MSMSQRFFYQYFNIMEVGKEYKIGDEQLDLTDQQLSRISRLTGGHQRCMSLARCALITDIGFQNLSFLTAIWFLDISYTQCVDISPLQSCKCIKSLNISGLKLTDYGALASIPSLELLSLSFGTIESTAPLSALSKLRSLNLGFTRVHDVSGVESCTRLEELLLDASKVTSAEDLGRVVQKLPQLRLLSVGETPCAAETRALRIAMPRNAVIHLYSST